MILSLLAAVVTALAMEPWAAWMHRRVWHGPMWTVHSSHHRPRPGWFEWNDIFPLLHAIPAIGLLVFGWSVSADWWVGQVAWGVGAGMTVFGVGYQIVHDGIAHRRLPLRFLEKIPYLRRVRVSHLRHHGRGGAPFGLFLGPWESEERAFRRKKREKREARRMRATEDSERAREDA